MSVNPHHNGLSNRPHLKMSWLVFAATAAIAVGAIGSAAGADGTFLWEIGRADNDDREFALAPQEYARFQNDGYFVVGESSPERDWPYVHPGPVDGWAGGGQHTFAISFGLVQQPAHGSCELVLDFLDTHGGNPPRLRVDINGTASEHALPAGAGDASVFGQPERGQEHKLHVTFDASLLKMGDNVIRLTTISGSWLLYDWIGLQTPPDAKLGKVQSRTLLDAVVPVRALVEKDGQVLQPILVSLRSFGGGASLTLRADDIPAKHVQSPGGAITVELLAPAVSAASERIVTVEVDGQATLSRSVVLKPVRKLTVYVLPHSHTDIGYTEIQTDIEKRQVNNLVEGIAYARKTADYPAGARFVWNVEVLWAADLYLRRLDDQQRASFLSALRSGQVALCGMYLNELTGLCRPEELLRLFRYATKLSESTGGTIDSAMISDVPGYTWGTVTAMNHAGVKYFSVAPNYFDRIGTILREWENRPFYWVGPDGTSRVLVWIPFWGYAMSHRYRTMSPQLVNDFCDGLESRGYPYDVAHVRWSGHGDNAVPDPSICEFVRDWNAKYTWPRFIISSTSEAFRALEDRYGDQLPLVRGDWTPYWEDGAGSSALETGLNRQSSDRLAQAEAVFALLDPARYPAAEFEDAWNFVLLYSEHTWGAWCSVGEPERQETREQWEIKQSYAREADRRSRELLARALQLKYPSAGPGATIDVLNTLAWVRTDLVTLTKEQSPHGDRVTDEAGQAVPSQRLRSGELVFLASDVPALGSRRYHIAAGAPFVGERAQALGTSVTNELIRVRLDEQTGGIAELRARGLAGNFVDTSGGETVNDFLYLPGDDLSGLQRNGPVTIRVGEPGPLVASLVVESPAPGCERLVREVRLVAGSDRVELHNLVDKKRIEAASYHAKEGKESVNFAFPFAVPGGEMWLDVPLGMMRPELDQMPSACKNWFTVGRWADVSNADRGITWVTLDAPLVQVGGITANLLNSQTNPDVWRQKVEPTQRLYSWAMNNHWGTNYRAYQEGPVQFRFSLRPHGPADRAAATRYATELSHALLVVVPPADQQPLASLLRVDPGDVQVFALKPSDDGHALIVRLQNTSPREQRATLHWNRLRPTKMCFSDTSERPGEACPDAVSFPPLGVVTIRAELP